MSPEERMPEEIESAVEQAEVETPATEVKEEVAEEGGTAETPTEDPVSSPADQPAEEAAPEPAADGEPAVESAPEPEKPPEIKPDSYARILRRSKTRKEEIARLQREKADLEARQKELDAIKEAADLGKRISAAQESGDLTSLLDTLGLDVQKINEAFVKSDGRLPTKSKTQDPEKIVESVIEKKLAERAAAEQAKREAAMATARAASIARVAANPAAAVLVKLNYAGEVFDYMEAVYNQTGRVPSEDEAIERVTTFVRETVLGESPQPAPKPTPKPVAKAAPQPAVKTLSSATAPSSAGSKKPSTDAEIEADVIQFLNDFKAGKVTS